MEKIKIQDKELEVVTLRLRKWTELEGLKKELDAAISKRDYTKVFDNMSTFIEMAVSPSPTGINWREVPWYEFLGIYSNAVKANIPKKEFPVMRGSNTDTKKLPWEYDGRSWYFWFNLFAKNYGWSESTIADLEVETAIGLYQEISIDEQLQREWEYSLSEIAYPYDSTTKKSSYKPLKRPQWMLPMVPKELPVVRMHKSHLPVGNIIDLQEVEKQRREAKRGI